MRVQITFLIFFYYFTTIQIEAYFHNDKTKVKHSDEKIDKLVFKELT